MRSFKAAPHDISGVLLEKSARICKKNPKNQNLNPLASENTNIYYFSHCWQNQTAEHRISDFSLVLNYAKLTETLLGFDKMRGKPSIQHLLNLQRTPLYLPADHSTQDLVKAISLSKHRLKLAFKLINFLFY